MNEQENIAIEATEETTNNETKTITIPSIQIFAKRVNYNPNLVIKGTFSAVFNAEFGQLFVHNINLVEFKGIRSLQFTAIDDKYGVTGYAHEEILNPKRREVVRPSAELREVLLKKISKKYDKLVALNNEIHTAA